jgi:hypothetical protein
MPEICRFLGIVIKMFFDDHNPPHFHAVYGHHNAAISIDSLKILEGSLPPRILGLVVEWASEHRKELEENWKRREKNLDLKKIKPLV